MASATKARPRGRPANATTALIPAGARGDALDDVEAVLNEEAIELFARAVGGRDKLADTLAVAGTGGSEIERVTTLLLDPRYRLWGLARLCSTVGITVADLFACYRKALILRAQIEATVHVADALPAVARDVMDKATPQPLLCTLCQGARTVGAIEPGQLPVPCPLCHGTGTVLSEPTVERHKLALELGQLLEKKGGLIVQQNNMAATLGATAPGSLEQLQQAVGDVLFGGGRALAQADGDPGDENEDDLDDDLEDDDDVVDTELTDGPAELPDSDGDGDPEPPLPYDDPPVAPV